MQSWKCGSRFTPSLRPGRETAAGAADIQSYPQIPRWIQGTNMRQKRQAAPVAFFQVSALLPEVHINRRFFGASVGAVRLNHESDSTGETRQDLKIPTVSGRSLPLRLPVPTLPFTGLPVRRLLGERRFRLHTLVSRLGVGHSCPWVS